MSTTVRRLLSTPWQHLQFWRYRIVLLGVVAVMILAALLLASDLSAVMSLLLIIHLLFYVAALVISAGAAWLAQRLRTRSATGRAFLGELATIGIGVLLGLWFFLVGGQTVGIFHKEPGLEVYPASNSLVMF